jgi:hypothetical protein
MQGALTGQCTSLDPHLIFLKAPCILPHYGPEEFQNPNITKIRITIEGIANKIFPGGMRMQDQWEEIKKHFMGESIKDGYYEIL